MVFFNKVIWEYNTTENNIAKGINDSYLITSKSMKINIKKITRYIITNGTTLEKLEKNSLVSFLLKSVIAYT